MMLADWSRRSLLIYRGSALNMPEIFLGVDPSCLLHPSTNRDIMTWKVYVKRINPLSYINTQSLLLYSPLSDTCTCSCVWGAGYAEWIKQKKMCLRIQEIKPSPMFFFFPIFDPYLIRKYVYLGLCLHHVYWYIYMLHADLRLYYVLSREYTQRFLIIALYSLGVSSS